MPLVFIALVVAMLIALHRDNKKQEKRIKENEDAKRYAHEKSLREKGISTALTCARDEMRIAQVLVRKGVPIEEAMKAARAEVEDMGYTPCCYDREFYDFNYDAPIPDDYCGRHDGESRRKETRVDELIKDPKTIRKDDASKWTNAQVFVSGRGYGKVVAMYWDENNKLRCTIKFLDGSGAEVAEEDLTKVG